MKDRKALDLEHFFRGITFDHIRNRGFLIYPVWRHVDLTNPDVRQVYQLTRSCLGFHLSLQIPEPAWDGVHGKWKGQDTHAS